jgi:hypothetical protein
MHPRVEQPCTRQQHQDVLEVINRCFLGVWDVIADYDVCAFSLSGMRT